MSGLIERIVRRRRASASSRLGPPSLNGGAPAYRPHANGGPPETAPAYVNGTEPVEMPAVVPPAEAEAPAEAAEAEARAEAAEAEARAVAAEPATPPAEDVAPAEEAEVTAPALEPDVPSEPGLRERGRLRRRARYLRRLREVQLRDIGGFVLELHRLQRERPDLVEAKIESAAQTDRELRALERALGTRQTLRELREPGIGGACLTCGAVYGTQDRFCATCGEPLDDGNAAASGRTGEFPQQGPPPTDPG
jgi:hypothetical protein